MTTQKLMSLFTVYPIPLQPFQSVTNPSNCHCGDGHNLQVPLNTTQLQTCFFSQYQHCSVMNTESEGSEFLCAFCFSSFLLYCQNSLEKTESLKALEQLRIRFCLTHQCLVLLPLKRPKISHFMKIYLYPDVTVRTNMCWIH